MKCEIDYEKTVSRTINTFQANPFNVYDKKNNYFAHLMVIS